jgi:hypothetical protein
MFEDVSRQNQMEVLMSFVNLTPHVIRLNSGTEFPPDGTVARASSMHTEFDVDGICSVQ